MNMIKLADEALTRMGLGERLVRPIIRRHFRWSPLVAILLAIMAVVIHFSALPGYWRGMAWLMMLLAFNLLATAVISECESSYHFEVIVVVN